MSMLLLTAPSECHVFDGYLDEILLTEGYNQREHVCAQAEMAAAHLAKYSLVIVSSGAARVMAPEAVEEYMRRGGRVIVFRPPAEWAGMFGLTARTEVYTRVVNAYLRVTAAHPWTRDFPAADLQVPGEMDACENDSAEALAFVAGQPGMPSEYLAVASKRVGEGAGVVFSYDLAACVVRLHQGNPEGASTGSNPDANGDGKHTGDDLFDDLREYRFCGIPQADVHQDLLVRAIVGLTEDLAPHPRLWHHPQCAPSTLLLDGDSDGMLWEELMLAVDACERHGAKYTCFLMESEIEAFAAEDLADLMARGHAFGPHPYVSYQPAVDEWREHIEDIVESMRTKLGIEPVSFRSHSCIFPGWDESPRICADNGLRYDTNFACGYRFQHGYANGSALPVKFVGRDGKVIDCYEQSTVHGDDILRSPKVMMPALSDDQCVELSMTTMREQATVYHGAYHPYFHPTYMGDRARFCSYRWFNEVLAMGNRLGMPAPSADEWVAFNDARRAATVEDLLWDAHGGQLTFALHSPLSVNGLTVMLPPMDGARISCVTVDGQVVHPMRVGYEGLHWALLELDLNAGDRVEIVASWEPQA